MSGKQRTAATALLAALVVGLAACAPATSEEHQEEGEHMDADRPRIEYIHREGAARLPVFTHAVRAGGFLFLSGAIGTVGNELRLVEGGVGPETRQTLENLTNVLTTAGATWEDVVKCTVFLADIADYAAMNEVYLEFMPPNPPARSAMAGSGLALGARVEVECIALAPDGD